jgi:hypothetical protein
MAAGWSTPTLINPMFGIVLSISIVLVGALCLGRSKAAPV